MPIGLLIFTIFIVLVVALLVGIYVGARLGRDAYNGVMIIEETPNGAIFRLELAGDPENLVFQESVRFKVIPPNYEALLRGEN